MADRNAVLTWFRIQPTPIGEDVAESLRCETRDALWLLARQWQLGEFSAEDAGAAAFSFVGGDSVPLSTLAATGRQPLPLGADAYPVNVTIEQLSPEFSLAFRLESGRKWQRMLQGTGLAAFGEAFRKNPILQFSLPDEKFAPDDLEQAACIREPYRQMLAALGTGRMADGWQLYDEFSTRSASDFLRGTAASQEEKDTVDQLAGEWLEWVRNTLGVADPGRPSFWDPSRLEYRARAGTSLPNTGRAGLEAPEHHGHPMHWYTWEESKEQTDGTDSASLAGHVRFRKACLPKEVSFPGMPRARWWEMEDGTIDMSNIQVSTTDTGLLLLTEFSLLYSNDWLIMPLSMTNGHLARVGSLRVTDVFGVQSFVPPANDSVSAAEWDIFHLNTESSSLLKDWLFLPPVANQWLQSEPLEEVFFIRDEMANMVWAMEKTIADGLGRGTDGKNAARAFESRLHMLAGVSEVPAEENSLTGAGLRYMLGNTTPPNWIPFMPVRLGAPESPKMVLRRAAIPRLIPDRAPTRIRPRSQMLRELVADGRRFDIEEEEIPVTGLTLRQVWRRARWTDGRVFTWLAREKTLGRHVTGSGLQFDQVKEK